MNQTQLDKKIDKFLKKKLTTFLILKMLNTQG